MRFNLNDLLAHTTSENGCRVWTRAKSKAGYGQIWDGLSVQYTHRLVAEIVFGSIPPGLDVMHSCDVRACCNPDHLSIGTRKQNMADASERKRLIGRNHVSGESHPSAKMSDADVNLMRALRLQGWKLKDLAQKFNVSIAATSKITRKETRQNASL